MFRILAVVAERQSPNRVNPRGYFADFLTRLVNSWPQPRIEELMTW
jgi:hypothetical protein